MNGFPGARRTDHIRAAHGIPSERITEAKSQRSRGINMHQSMIPFPNDLRKQSGQSADCRARVAGPKQSAVTRTHAYFHAVDLAAIMVRQQVSDDEIGN